MYARPDWIDKKASRSPSDKEKTEAERGLELYWGLLGFRKWDSEQQGGLESDASFVGDLEYRRNGEIRKSVGDGLGGLENSLLATKLQSIDHDQYEKENCEHIVQIDHEVRAELWGIRANERKWEIERIVPGLFV